MVPIEAVGGFLAVFVFGLGIWNMKLEGNDLGFLSVDITHFKPQVLDWRTDPFQKKFGMQGFKNRLYEYVSPPKDWAEEAG